MDVATAPLFSPPAPPVVLFTNFDTDTDKKKKNKNKLYGDSNNPALSVSSSMQRTQGLWDANDNNNNNDYNDDFDEEDEMLAPMYSRPVLSACTLSKNGKYATACSGSKAMIWSVDLDVAPWAYNGRKNNNMTNRSSGGYLSPQSTGRKNMNNNMTSARGDEGAGLGLNGNNNNTNENNNGNSNSSGKLRSVRGKTPTLLETDLENGVRYTSCTFSNKDSEIVIGASDGKCHMLYRPTGELIRFLHHVPPRTFSYSDLDNVNNNNNNNNSNSNNSNNNSGMNMNMNNNMGNEEEEETEHHASYYIINHIQCSTTDKMLATCGGDGRVVLWHVKSGQKICELKHKINFDGLMDMVEIPESLNHMNKKGKKKLDIIDETQGEDDADDNDNDNDDASFDYNGDQEEYNEYGEIKSKVIDPDLLACNKFLNSVISEQTIKYLDGHSLIYAIHSCAFTSDDKIIATVGETETIDLWDISDLQVDLFGPDDDTSSRNNTSRNSHRSNSINNNDTIDDNDNEDIDKPEPIVTFKDQPVRRLRGHEHWINGIAFNNNDSKIASIDVAGVLIVWDFESGNMLEKINAHDGQMATSVAFVSLEGNLILTSSNDKSIRLWNIDSTSVVVNSISDSKNNLSSETEENNGIDNNNNNIEQNNESNQKRKGSIQMTQKDPLLILQGHESGVKTVRYFKSYTTRDKKSFRYNFLSCGIDQRLLLWKIPADEGITAMTSLAAFAYCHGSQKTDTVIKLAIFSASGKTLLTVGYSSNFVHVWAIRNGRLIGLLPGHQRNVTCVSFADFTTKDNEIVTGDESGNIYLWSLRPEFQNMKKNKKKKEKEKEKAAALKKSKNSNKRNKRSSKEEEVHENEDEDEYEEDDDMQLIQLGGSKFINKRWALHKCTTRSVCFGCMDQLIISCDLINNILIINKNDGAVLQTINGQDLVVGKVRLVESLNFNKELTASRKNSFNRKVQMEESHDEKLSLMSNQCILAHSMTTMLIWKAFDGDIAESKNFPEDEYGVISHYDLIKLKGNHHHHSNTQSTIQVAISTSNGKVLIWTPQIARENDDPPAVSVTNTIDEGSTFNAFSVRSIDSEKSSTIDTEATEQNLKNKDVFELAVPSMEESMTTREYLTGRTTPNASSRSSARSSFTNKIKSEIANANEELLNRGIKFDVTGNFLIAWGNTRIVVWEKNFSYLPTKNISGLTFNPIYQVHIEDMDHGGPCVVSIIGGRILRIVLEKGWILEQCIPSKML